MKQKGSKNFIIISDIPFNNKQIGKDEKIVIVIASKLHMHQAFTFCQSKFTLHFFNILFL